jgi:hypothetical protein
MRSSNHHWIRFVVLASVVVVARPSMAAARQVAASTDLRLVTPGGMGGPVDMKPGPPPSGFPLEVLPSGMTPTASGVNGTRTVVTGTLASRAARWRADYIAAVSSLGWTPQRGQQPGFVMGGPSESVGICKGPDFVDVAITPGASGNANVRATLTRDPRRVCANHGPGATMGFADVAFPTLEAPSGAKASTGGSGGSSSEWSSHAQITTELSMASLADHYRAQILDAGWTEEGAPAFMENAMVIRYKAPSTLGPALPAMLIITALDGPRDFDLLIRVVRPGRLPGM